MVVGDNNSVLTVGLGVVGCKSRWSDISTFLEW